MATREVERLSRRIDRLKKQVARLKWEKKTEREYLRKVIKIWQERCYAARYRKPVVAQVCAK